MGGEALPDFVEVTAADGVALDLRYATPDNVFGRVLDPSPRLLLHRVAAAKLKVAVALLAERRPGWRLLVFDGWRRPAIQRLMWEAVKGTERQPYVADPAVGSIHGYGLAVDCSIRNASGAELDMGTGFDDFSTLAEPRHETGFLLSGKLTTAQVANRHLLRRIMTEAGFHPIPIEWWHFDALPPDEVRRSHRLVG